MHIIVDRDPAQRTIIYTKSADNAFSSHNPRLRNRIIDEIQLVKPHLVFISNAFDPWVLDAQGRYELSSFITRKLGYMEVMTELADNHHGMIAATARVRQPDYGQRMDRIEAEQYQGVTVARMAITDQASGTVFYAFGIGLAHPPDEPVRTLQQLVWAHERLLEHGDPVVLLGELGDVRPAPFFTKLGHLAVQDDQVTRLNQTLGDYGLRDVDQQGSRWERLGRRVQQAIGRTALLPAGRIMSTGRIHLEDPLLHPAPGEQPGFSVALRIDEI